MKFTTVLFLCVLMLGMGFHGLAAGDKTPPTDEKTRAGYALGYNVSKNLFPLKAEFDMTWFLKGIKDGFAGQDSCLLSEAELNKLMMEFGKKARMIQREQRLLAGQQNKLAGEKFLKENATKEGIKITKSGLQYKVIKEGTGAVPKATDKVKVHYLGTKVDGSVFDSTYKRGTPVEFPLNSIIPGWTEGVLLMKVGAKYKFFIPSNLAYGKRGKGRNIGPDCTLIFDIELLAIVKKEIAPKKGITPKKIK
ncbi:MAG: FKBP-type peptidyl-prolyl cis-trans isomerase [bacterium]|nr:FKBP-type peptidyl-prolyl cis-trans isomerase [bacterium]